MPYIEIESSVVRVRSGDSPKTGKPYSISEQIGYFYRSGSKHSQEIKIELEKDQLPFAPGRYELNDESFFVNRYGNLSLNSKLILIQAPVGSSAPAPITRSA